MRLLIVLLLYVLTPKVGLSQNTKDFNVECASLSNQGAILITISKNRANTNYPSNRAIKESTTAMIESIKENSVGFVRAMELLTSFEIDNGERVLFVYIKEM